MDHAVGNFHEIRSPISLTLYKLGERRHDETSSILVLIMFLYLYQEHGLTLTADHIFYL